MTDSANGEDTGPSEDGPQLPEVVDWIVATIIALAGVALTVGGSALTFVVDRDLIEAGVESGQITVIIFERDLTEAEMLEVTLEVVTWTGWGLLLTGIGLVLFAIGYVIVRHRTYRQTPETESAGSYRSYAVLGAVATGILSFLPFSPVIGGGAAGYLERYGTGRTVSVGALSGFLAMVPVLVLLVFVTIGLYAGLATVQYSGLGIVTAAAMLFALLFTAAYGAGLGALGGFAGGRVAER
ncbi:DUF5518 domain-containing protein [Halobellus limi]|uniref:Uncharacterized protein n=1 Tax=Halobellus limi TaxID=699433 RepID=A0A1H6CF83_9EURY|nr:DUF5518 domain-containing protein [Halobellus limi]QCC49539.1 hypothetical protein DV707_17540 [Halobellus limi]SEG71624.1 hypothetical protein SAMN04488133_3418 [Halobellus limi]